MSHQDDIKKLKRHAYSFLQRGLCSYSGYWPDDFYGKEAQQYYEWSQRAYELIEKLDDGPCRTIAEEGGDTPLNSPS